MSQVDVLYLDDTYPPEKGLDFATPYSAGADLRISEDTIVTHDKVVMVGTGVKLNIYDKNSFGLVALRSSLGKKGLVLANGVGVIDADYQGEIKLLLTLRTPLDSRTGGLELSKGDRIAQVLFLPYTQPDLVSVESFSETSDRGEGGFGSTGKD